jgi:hypothetical protein
MHPVIARAIAAQRTKDLHAEAAAERLARQASGSRRLLPAGGSRRPLSAGRSRRPWPAVRLSRAGRTGQAGAAPHPARDAAAA